MRASGALGGAARDGGESARRLLRAARRAASSDEDEAVATAELFKALADPARVRIVNALATSRRAGVRLRASSRSASSQPTVSHHLKKLTDAGLLEREQRGKWAYFSLRRDAVEKLAAVADLKGVCC